MTKDAKTPDGSAGGLAAPRMRLRRLIASLVMIPIVVLAIVIFMGFGTRCYSPSWVKDASNLRQIAISLYLYADENDGRLPIHPRDATGFISHEPSVIRRVYLSPYQNDDAAIDRGDGDGVTVRYGSYVFVNLGSDIDEIEKPAEFILAYSAITSRKQTVRNVVFVDGHVERIEEQVLQTALPEGVDVDALDGP